MIIEFLTVEQSLKYKSEITQFYFDNVRANQLYECYTLQEAEAKIDSFIDHLEKDECLAFGAFDCDKIVGFIWAYKHSFREERRMYVNEIRVREEYRGRGIGSELLKSVEEKSKELGIDVIYLHAEGNNSGSRVFYDRCGYIEERIQFRKELKR